MSEDRKEFILRLGFLLSIVFWGLNIAFNRISYISPSANFGLIQYIPLVFVIPLSFTLFYAIDSIKKGKKYVFLLFFIFFFILWSTPYLIEEQVRDWDAYWHGFASYRISQGIIGPGNGRFLYSSEFPGAFTFFASIFTITGSENFLTYLKYIPLIILSITTIGIITFFLFLGKIMPKKKRQLQYTIFLSTIINPFFSFHLSPQAFGLMVVYFFFAIILISYKYRKNWIKKLFFPTLLLIALVISHPTTFLFVFLFIIILPFTGLKTRRRIRRKSRLISIVTSLFVLVASFFIIQWLSQHTDSVIISNLNRNLNNFIETIKNPKFFHSYLDFYSTTKNISSLIQKAFFIVTIPIIFYFFVLKGKTRFLKAIFLSSIVYLVILVGISGGSFLGRPFIFLAIPLAYGILNLRIKRILIDKKAVIAICLLFILFIPTFYWSECTVMFTDDELEAMEYSWAVTGENEGISLSESHYPYFFMIGEENTYILHKNTGYTHKVELNYDKIDWSNYNLKRNTTNSIYDGDNVNKYTIFNSDKISVYYLR